MNRILDNAGEALGAGLPRIAAAIVLLVFGLIAVRLLARLLVKALRTAGLDDLAERHGVHDALARLGFERSLSRAVGVALRLAGTVVVILAALSLTGLQFLRESINQGILFLPKLLVALALMLAGAVVATLARGRVERLAEQMDLPRELGRVAEIAILTVFGVTALRQVGVSTDILTLLAAIILSAVALGFALAFGLGNREVVRAAGAGRVVRSVYDAGAEIEVAGHRGEVVAIESSALVLRTASGASVRIPNHLLIESVVVVHRSAPGEGPAR
ncbi:MAG TPA: mechanosensitive ion channel domain-containing protein [Solirubrobacteraceae bacterium]|jgi:small-conductance mechanosensitive channel